MYFFYFKFNNIGTKLIFRKSFEANVCFCVVGAGLSMSSGIRTRYWTKEAVCVASIIGESPVQRYIASNLDRRVVTLRHPSKGGPVGTSSDDGIRRDPSRLRVVGLQRVEIVKDLSKKKTAIASYSALIHYRYIWEG